MDRLADLLRFIDLMVRQTCRRAHYDYLTRPKGAKDDKDSIYSIYHLKKVYDKPREYVYQLVKNPQNTLKGVRVENGAQKKDSKFTKIEQKMLLDFVKKVHFQAPKLHFIWIDLQHYLFYVYRNFTCQSPKPPTETLSAYFICEMRERVNCLRLEDESQVWLRIFSLLREYCIFAQWHYSQNDKEEALKKFFAYYEAMLTAAKTLIPVFSDFERDIIYKNYKVCWIDFNTFIFIEFFYESNRVRVKIDDCLKTKKSPGDDPQMFVAMNKLKKTWAEHTHRISMINQERKLPENTQDGIREKRALAAHKKLLSATFWVERTKESKKIIDLDRIDDNLFDLMKDKHFYPEGPGLNRNGQCICEECLIAKYKNFLDSQDDFSYISTSERTIYCRKCKTILNLDQYQRHINNHVEGLTKDSRKLSQTIFEKIDLLKLKNSPQLNELWTEKLKENSSNKPQSHITAKKLAETELMLREIKNNGHRPTKSYSNNNNNNNNFNTNLTLACKTHSELPVKKCTCTYCEIFGFQKMIEPRDKLRVRLYRRKESRKENDNNQKPLEKDDNTNKMESRVPLPPSPSIIPVTPPDLKGHPLRKIRDIRGLLNYIEGNSDKNKEELAQKKAAKKARQREKREQEKLQAELEALEELEELVRKEEECKKELQREKEELEKQRKIEEAKLKKMLKKQRQAQKRQELAIQKNTIEETIPAMVTIKRIPGGENGIPSVTITLKGCTPDQDKLLTTLVEEPKIVENNGKAKSDPLIESKSGKKKRNKQKDSGTAQSITKEPKVIAKDVKVILAVDKMATTPKVQESIQQPKESKKEQEACNNEITALGNLRLPPGITITKVDGPVTNKTYLTSDTSNGSSVLGKSGVIVVDTEKLIQKTETEVTKVPSKSSRKKKKKNKSKIENEGNESKPKMVTLRNPMFHQFQNQNIIKTPLPVDESAPAAIFTSENGIVTIRSSRLQQSLENGGKPLGLPLMPEMFSQIPNFHNPNATTKEKRVSTIDAQEILSGLPGIEITKIDKNNEKIHDADIDNTCHDAQVSIIPSNGTGFELEYEKDDDWLYGE
ncbi:hypothetical protein ABEB36_011394 [Hypothenemus hampei]|uniref:Uncharacterized protein n=1 Tax=Hypothenemus hampei TaxID=57062 RepID=A0ABD1EFA3_HYPHA